MEVCKTRFRVREVFLQRGNSGFWPAKGNSGVRAHPSANQPRSANFPQFRDSTGNITQDDMVREPQNVTSQLVSKTFF